MDGKAITPTFYCQLLINPKISPLFLKKLEITVPKKLPEIVELLKEFHANNVCLYLGNHYEY